MINKHDINIPLFMIKQTSGEIAPLNLIFFVVVIVLVALQLFVFVQNRIKVHIEQT